MEDEEEENDDELDDGGSADDESDDRDDMRLGRRLAKRNKPGKVDSTRLKIMTDTVSKAAYFCGFASKRIHVSCKIRASSFCY